MRHALNTVKHSHSGEVPRGMCLQKLQKDYEQQNLVICCGGEGASIQALNHWQMVQTSSSVENIQGNWALSRVVVKCLNSDFACKFKQPIQFHPAREDLQQTSTAKQTHRSEHHNEAIKVFFLAKPFLLPPQGTLLRVHRHAVALREDSMPGFWNADPRSTRATCQYPKDTIATVATGNAGLRVPYYPVICIPDARKAIATCSIKSLTKELSHSVCRRRSDGETLAQVIHE